MSMLALFRPNIELTQSSISISHPLSISPYPFICLSFSIPPRSIKRKVVYNFNIIYLKGFRALNKTYPWTWHWKNIWWNFPHILKNLNFRYVKSCIRRVTFLIYDFEIQSFKLFFSLLTAYSILLELVRWRVRLIFWLTTLFCLRNQCRNTVFS